MKIWRIFALLAGSLSLCLASASKAAPLEPSSSWNLAYDADSCALTRAFAQGKNIVRLEFRRFEPGLGLQAMVVSNRMHARTPPNFQYRFGDAGDWHPANNPNTLTLADHSSGVLFAPAIIERPEVEYIKDPVEQDAYRRSRDWQAVEEAAAAGIQTFALRRAFGVPLILHTGSLARPIAALNQCADELLTHWGIDVEAHKTLTRGAIPTNLDKVGSMMDYPPEMIRRSMQGVVNVRLSIDEHGDITGCRIQMPLSDPAFEASSCADIEHAIDFDPALDKDGNPIASYWVTKVYFSISH
ncbi:MAG: energy transducer TonB [Croceibacterium sp.]